MTDVLLVRYEIEQGETDRLREWLEEAGEQRQQVTDLLRKEGMLTESLFVEERDDGDYLVLYQEAEDIQRVLEVYGAEDADLVEGSRELFDETLVGGLERPAEVVEPVFHAVNPDRSSD